MNRIPLLELIIRTTLIQIFLLNVIIILCSQAPDNIIFVMDGECVRTCTLYMSASICLALL